METHGMRKLKQILTSIMFMMKIVKIETALKFALNHFTLVPGREAFQVSCIMTIQNIQL